MTLLDNLGQSFSGFAWGSIWTIVFWIVVLMGVIFVIAGIWFFMWWKTFNYSVRIYEPRGQVVLSPEDSYNLYKGSPKEKVNLIKEKNLKFDQLKFKRTHGKYVTVKGTPYFQTFMPFRKHQPVPMELLFHDGIHLLKLSREIFVPIPRPDTTINVGESVSISVKDNNEWRLWNNMMAERVNAKYSDLEAQKRVILYVIIGIVAMVLIGSLILYLIYRSMNKGWDAADKLGSVAERLSGGGSTPS